MKQYGFFIDQSRCSGKLKDELLNREVFYTFAEAKILIEQ